MFFFWKINDIHRRLCFTHSNKRFVREFEIIAYYSQAPPVSIIFFSRSVPALWNARRSQTRRPAKHTRVLKSQKLEKKWSPSFCWPFLFFSYRKKAMVTIIQFFSEFFLCIIFAIFFQIGIKFIQFLIAKCEDRIECLRLVSNSFCVDGRCTCLRNERVHERWACRKPDANSSFDDLEIVGAFSVEREKGELFRKKKLETF